MSQLFEKATKMKLRFESTKGLLSVEQLWDLPLTHPKHENLDSLAIKYHGLTQQNQAISFVEEVKKESTDALRLDILKHIIGVKLAEKEQAKQAALNRSEKQRLLAVIERKQNQADEALSIEALSKKIQQLEPK